MQKNVHITDKWSKSKLKVDFQYGGSLFFKNGNSYCDVYVGGKVRVLEFIRFSYLEHHGSK